MEKQVLFFGVCYYSGLMRLVQWWSQRSGKRLIILNYHRASGGNLRHHLLYLRRHYRLMHFEDALDELYTPCKKKRQIQNRGRPLVLTFDDGYRDNYTHAFALARELQVPITIFLIPGYIESRNCFWWLEGDRLVRHAQVNQAELEGFTYNLNEQEDNKALIQAIYTRVCNAKSVTEREIFLAKVRDVLAVPLEITLEEQMVLTWAEIREMEDSGWVSFGAHTMHHPVLGFLTDNQEVQHEVIDCRTVLERQLGHQVRIFAYPLGQPEHIGVEGLRAVRDAGYTWAVTTIDGFNTPNTDPLQLKRIVGDVKRHWLIIAAQTLGMRNFFSPFFSYARVLFSLGNRILALPSKFLVFRRRFKPVEKKI